MDKEWERKGECNQCGECCRQATNCVDVLIPIHPKDEAFGRVRFGDPIVPRLHGANRLPPAEGSAIAMLMFRARGPVVHPCPKLDGDRCTIEAQKPEYCREFPVNPEDIDGLGKCSYWFVNQNTGEIKGTPVSTT